MVYKRKKYHYGDTHLKKKWRTKRRKKDLDEIDEDLKEENAQQLLTQDTNIDKPGQAQFYCIHCARYFINDQAMKEHFRTKVHKRRMKALEIEPYSIEESERAAGQGSFKQAPKRKIETQPSKDELESDTNLVKKLRVESIFKRSTSSALYITGDKAHETFAVLTPHVDFDEQLKNKNVLMENIKARELNLNLDEIVSVWIFYKKFQAQKIGLENARSNIAKLIKALPPEKSKEQIDKLITHGRMIKDDLKAVKDNFYSVEENAMTKVLSVPNIIHERTPISEPLVIYKSGDAAKNKSCSNFEIAHNLDLVEFKDNNSYFLKNDAALFELGSTFYISDELLKKEYVEFSNSDFSRSVIVEGCGLDYTDPNQVFTVNETDLDHKHENSRLHLTGGSSLSSFMAYHAKHTIFPSLLPLKYFTIGRKYSPVSSQEKTLLEVPQESTIDIFVATLDDLDAMDTELDKIFKDVTDIYESLGYHFRVCYIPAKELNKWESLRVSIQMYSAHLEKYVEVGFLSICDNYVSKRLLFNYGTGYDISFPRVISGTVFSVPKVLACLIENDKGNALIHDNFKKYIS